jgi:hypothetical protein
MQTSLEAIAKKATPASCLAFIRMRISTGSPVREFRTPGPERGAASNRRPYQDTSTPSIVAKETREHRSQLTAGTPGISDAAAVQNRDQMIAYLNGYAFSETGASFRSLKSSAS